LGLIIIDLMIMDLCV